MCASFVGLFSIQCCISTSLADRSQSLPAFLISLASSDRLFSKLPVSLRQLQYLPDLLKLGSLTTCESTTSITPYALPASVQMEASRMPSSSYIMLHHSANGSTASL